MNAISFVTITFLACLLIKKGGLLQLKFVVRIGIGVGVNTCLWAR